MQISQGMAQDAHPRGAKELPGAEEKAGQWLTEVFVEQGARLCSPSSSCRGPTANHSLVCKETTDQWSGCHWLLVQSKEGQKLLSKLGGSMDVWDVECLGWAGSTSPTAP